MKKEPKIDKSAVELQILQLTKLQNICNDIIDMEKSEQNDTELITLLKKNYTSSKEEIKSIQSIVFGKKKGEGVSQSDIDKLKKECESYCVITEINPLEKDGKFIGYSKIKSRSSNKKNILSKKLKDLEGKGE